jgi:hypothetical protein
VDDRQATIFVKPLETRHRALKAEPIVDFAELFRPYP